MKVKIYHNNRCSKSRQCLALMPNDNIEIVDYIKNPLTKNELAALISKMDINPSQLIRKKEAIWKENFKTNSLSEEECLEAMTKYPKLIERPIVETKDKALVCRPPELVLEFLV